MNQGVDCSKFMIHLLYGPDTYTMSQDLAAFRADFKTHAPQGAVEDLNAAAENFTTRLREALESQGLFAREKLIIIRDFVSEAARLVEEEKFLSRAMEALPENYGLVFVEAGEVDERRVFFKKLKKIAKVKSYPLLEGKDLEVWIGAYLHKQGFRIEKAASIRFFELLGGSADLWQVTSELEKLMLYREGGRVGGAIRLSDVTALVPPNVSQTVFDLTNLFAEKRQPEALRVLENLLRDGPAYEVKNQAIQIIGALAGQIRSLLLLKGFANKDNDAVAAELGWKSGRVWINRKLAARFSETRLSQMLRDLRAIDLRLKTSEEPPKLLLALFLQKAAH